MTGAGKSKRSRVNRQRMSQEYLEHWEDRLPRAEKPESYKKLGLPLVLLPFVLMFCGGCVATAPAASILVVALAGLMWFGDVVIAASKTTSYWVVYRNQPLWKVGETKAEVEARRKSKTPEVGFEDRYPEDYAGRIQCLIPIEQPRPPWANDLMGCEQLSLTQTQVKQCWRRELKIVDSSLVPAELEDRLGAVSPQLRLEYSDAVLVKMLGTLDGETQEERDCQTRQTSLVKSLAPAVTSTGTGLYAVKKSPTNETEEQDGAVAGQVVTIVGTVAASPAFTGGYISNTTQAEVRAIVSHNTTTATMEGDISGWGTGDVLEFYDSWGTVDAAGEQLLVDQSTAAFTVEQVIEVYDGNYNEAVLVSGFLPVSHAQLVLRAASGETAVVIDNVGTGSHAIYFSGSRSVRYEDFSVESNVNNNWAIVTEGGSEVSNVNVSGAELGIYHNYEVSDIWLHDCTLTGLYQGVIEHGMVENNYFVDCSTAIVVEAYTSPKRSLGNIVGNVFDGNTACIWYRYTQNRPYAASGHTLTIVNNTVYDSTYFIQNYDGSSSPSVRFVAYNNIFHTITTVWEANVAGAELGRVMSDYNTYYNCTNVARLTTTTYNFAAWQALTDTHGGSPDANSVTTDPNLTTPGSDWSLTAASNCRHAGIGSYVLAQAGINAVAFDKWHPDKGAWSSGPGPNVAYAG